MRQRQQGAGANAYTAGMKRVWIICLMLALLPLRGWAWSTMVIDHGAASSQGMAHANAAQDTDTALPPCHQQASAQAALPDHPEGQTPPCSLCDICHAGAISAGQLRMPTAASWAPSAPPVPVAGHGGGRQRFHELDKPPRG